MKSRAFLFLICAALPGAAWAQPYFSVNLGWASADFPVEAPFNGFADDSAPVFGFDAGIGFGDWAVELGLAEYGNFDGRAAPCPEGGVCTLIVTEETIDQNIYEAALVRRFTIRNFELFGKAGYYKANIDTDIPYEPSDFAERGLLLGIGARWYFDAPWSVSIEGTRYDDNVSQLAVGFGWGLGFRDGDRERARERDRDRDARDDRRR